MPLKKGSSKAVVSSNIKTLVDDWKEDGSIGTSHPPTKQKAIKQAVSRAGKEALAHGDLKSTVKGAVKAAVKEAVKEMVREEPGR